MRKKTDAKRQAILKVATQVFREMGFQNASMNEIAARLGGSKTTLYNYFPSKDEILLEVMRDVAEAQKNEFISFFEQPFPAITEDSLHQVDELFSELQRPVENIGATLRRFGEKFIRFAYSPEFMAIHRLLLAESARSEIGRFYYEGGPRQGMERIAAFLGEAMKSGQLREADPGVAALHLRGLLESEVRERTLLRVEETLSDSRVTQVVENAIVVFLAAYSAK